MAADLTWLLRQDARLREALATVPGPGWLLYCGDETRYWTALKLGAEVPADGPNWQYAWLPHSECAIVAKAAEVRPTSNFGLSSWRVPGATNDKPWSAWANESIVGRILQETDIICVRGTTAHEAACRILAAALGVEWVEDPAS